MASMERRLARMTEQLDLQSLEMLRLKKANSKLIEANRQLREGVEAQVIEPSAINRSLVAELEALRAERASELAEMEDVLGELKPLMGTGERDAMNRRLPLVIRISKLPASRAKRSFCLRPPRCWMPKRRTLLNQIGRVPCRERCCLCLA